MPSGPSTCSARNASSGWPGGDLDDPAQHVGGDAVVPLGAGLEQQRQAGPRVAGRGEVHPARGAELEALGPVHLVHRAGVVEAVGQPGGVGEQVPDPDRLDRPGTVAGASAEPAR